MKRMFVLKESTDRGKVWVFLSEHLKETRNSLFLCKSSVNVCITEILKSTATEKVIVCFSNLGEENF